jgi:hypothetical protein
MPTRRDFLSGAGTVLTGLMFPAAASAWGRRRRCQPSCPPPAPTCPTCPTAVPAELRAGACDFACPIALYGQADSVYYYYCICCPGGNMYVDASSPNLISCPQNCGTTGNCIRTYNNTPIIGAFAMKRAGAARDRLFLLDNAELANGLPYARKDLPFVRFDGRSINPTKWYYKDGGGNPRGCILWDVPMPAPLNYLTLHVGREIDKNDVGAPPAAANTLDSGGTDGHHHTARNPGGTVYHIIARDP